MPALLLQPWRKAVEGDAMAKQQQGLIFWTSWANKE
jgi:hypothetical protein